MSDCNREPNFTLLIPVNFRRTFHIGITYSVTLLRNKYIITFAMFTPILAIDSAIAYALQLIRIITFHGEKKKKVELFEDGKCEVVLQ